MEAPDADAEEGAAEREGHAKVKLPAHAHGHEQERHQHERREVADDVVARDLLPALHGQDLEAGAPVVFAAEDGDGQKMGDLPQEHDPEEQEARPFDRARDGRPPEQRGDGARHRADEQGERGAPLERCIEQHVARERDRAEQARRGVDPEGQERHRDGR